MGFVVNAYTLFSNFLITIILICVNGIIIIIIILTHIPIAKLRLGKHYLEVTVSTVKPITR